MEATITERARPLRLALIQNDAGPDPAVNLARLERRIARLPAGTDLIALPEVFAARGHDDDLRAAAERIPGPVTGRLAALAARRRVWVLAGSVLERSGGRIYNTSLLIDRRGRIAARYRKMHLFEAALASGQVVRERDVYAAGSMPVMADLEGWRCGLAICYDLRFPELFRYYVARGATLLFLPSNFTQQTGRAHWETLVRARAIENQACVVAPNQCGRNRRTGVASYGHSLVIGPWGETLAAAGTRETTLRTVLDPGAVRRIRDRIPALRHRRLAPVRPIGRPAP